MTLVTTMSAVTAAYAAQAIKPSVQKSGEGATEEAVTLLSVRPKENLASTHAPIAALSGPTAMSLILSRPDGRQPQGTRREAVARYREFDLEEDQRD